MRTASDGYGRFTHPTLQPREYSVEKAGEAFARAGFTRRGADGILENADGTRLSFTLTTGYQRLADPLTILEQEARKAGVEFKLEILDSTAGWKKVQEKKHEIMLTALNVSVEPYPRYHDNYHSYNAFNEDGSLKANTNNFTVTSDPPYDALIERYDESQGPGRDHGARPPSSRRRSTRMLLSCPATCARSSRCAYWRWIRWPEGFNVRMATEHDEYHLYWIDEKLKEGDPRREKEGRVLWRNHPDLRPIQDRLTNDMRTHEISHSRPRARRRSRRGAEKRRKTAADDLGHRVLSAAEIEAAKAFKHPLAEAYYKEHPEFFVFASPAGSPGGPEVGGRRAACPRSARRRRRRAGPCARH